MKKFNVGIVGATGYVGQRFVSILENHPWFNIVAMAASPGKTGKTYEEALGGNWKIPAPFPSKVASLKLDHPEDVKSFGEKVDFIFCAVSMESDETKKLEELFAKAEIPVVSNNSANRWTEDVPVLLPEINPDHVEVISAQKERLGTKRGFIVTKPNCSIQSYVPVLKAWEKFKPTRVSVSTYQAISGSGKTFSEWPEMNDNVIPYIGGEEEKSEMEPLKVFGKVVNGKIVNSEGPIIGAQCIRVPVSDGHLATVSLDLEVEATAEELILALKNFVGKAQELNLPSAPKPFITYFEEDNRPQTGLDRDIEGGMGISVGRVRKDNVFDWKFVGLSHNTIRGAAGGAVLTAEYLAAMGYFDK